MLSIQQQLCEANISENVEPVDTANLSPRMARIITKLFARVVKAEESLSNAYFRNGVYVDSIFLSITAVFLMKPTDLEYEYYKPCQNMVRVLVLSILKAAKMQNNISRLNEIVDNLPIKSEKVAIFELMKTCSAELGIDLSYRETSSYHIVENTSDIKHDKIILPQLVSTVGSAENDSERRQAVEKLRTHVSNFGYDDLLSHLETVSSTFKDYILEQLKTNDSGMFVSEQGKNLSDTLENNKEITMSEKLRYLKSKLHATEAAVHSAFNANAEESTIINSRGTVETTTSISQHPSAIKREVSNDKTISSIREKLASAHQQRALRLAESSQILGKEAPTYPFTSVDVKCNEVNITSDNDKKKAIELDHHVSFSASSSDSQSTASFSDRNQSRNKVPSSPSVLGSAATLRARLQQVKRNKYKN